MRPRSAAGVRQLCPLRLSSVFVLHTWSLKEPNRWPTSPSPACRSSPSRCTRTSTCPRAAARSTRSSPSRPRAAGRPAGCRWPRGPGPARRAGQAPDAAVVIMVDCSGSMDYPPTKMRNARDATAAAIDTLRDGTRFAVVAGTHVAKDVYPGNGQLATADPATKAQAKEALRRLSAGGGTAIGTWLRLADRLLGAADADIRHGILLTDGRNEHESPEDLRAALDSCAGPVHLRRAGCRHRLGGERGHSDRLRPARHGRHRRRSGGPGRGLHADDGERDGQGGRGRGAAALDARRCGDRVRQAGGAHGRRPDRPPHRGGAARRATTRPAPGATSPATTTCA